MRSTCCSRLGQNVREELWSYCALAGILFFNTAIVLLVYAYKRATNFPVLVEIVGIALLVLGAISTLASWYVHRQQRHKRRACLCLPCCCRCCCRGRGKAMVSATTTTSSAASTAVAPSMFVRQAKFFTKGNGRLFGGGRVGDTAGAGGGGGNAEEGSNRTFSTPEFRRYAEFVSRKTAGVETDTKRANLDSPKSYRSIYPELQMPGQDRQTLVQAFVNPRIRSDNSSSSPRSPALSVTSAPATPTSAAAVAGNNKTKTMHITLNMPR